MHNKTLTNSLITSLLLGGSLFAQITEIRTGAQSQAGTGNTNFRVRDDGSLISSAPKSLDFFWGLKVDELSPDSMEVKVDSTTSIPTKTYVQSKVLLTNLFDVSVAGASAGKLLIKNSGGLWVDSTLAGVSVDTVENLAGAGTKLYKGMAGASFMFKRLVASAGAGQITYTDATDSVRIETLPSDSSNITNGGIAKEDIRVSSIDSTRLAPGGVTQGDIRVSSIDSSRIVPGGITQSDVRVSTLDSSRIAPGGLTQSDLRVSTLDSSRIAPVSLTDSDIRVSTITAGKVTPLFLKSLTGNGVSLIKQRTATSWEFKKLVGTFGTGGTSFITDATDSVRIDFEPFFKAAAPIQFSVDSASAMAADTMWVWRNVSSGTITVDSINVDASSDDYAISIVKRNSGGGLGALVDAVTASTNGTNTFYTTETTITSATIPRFGWIGFKRPTSTGKRVSVRIHYH